MSQPRRKPQVFVRRRVSLLRLLWRSRLGVGLALLMLGAAIQLGDGDAPAYARFLPLAAGLAIGLWRGPVFASMLRAAQGGEVRQARINRHQASRWMSNGLALHRLCWRDATGAEGQGPPTAANRLPIPGSTILVYVDPKTGRGWWEEDL